MKPRHKKTERQKLVVKLDNVVKEIVRVRDEWTCQKCGKKFDPRDRSSLCSAHTAHIIGKGSGGYRLRWDLINVVLLCHHCHINVFHQSGKGIEEWLKKNFPARGQYLELLKAKPPLKFTDSELAEMLKMFQEKLRELQ